MDNDDNKEVADFEDNFKDKFEFKEISDNYIEDNIYDNLKIKVKEIFFKKKCSCHSSNQPCFMKIGYERFLAR
jgi:hypothetical protein